MNTILDPKKDVNIKINVKLVCLIERIPSANQLAMQTY